MSKNAAHDDLTDRLSRYREITITVTGRKSGRSVSHAVWFVFVDGNVHLLPVHGSDTQWYKNVLEKPSMRIDARGVDGGFKTTAITGVKQVSSVVEEFRAKYGAGDVKKYYAKFDVAVIAKPDIAA